MLEGILVFAVFFGAMISFAIWRGWQIRRLATCGVAAQAVVRKKLKYNTNTGSQRRIRYSFSVNGKEYCRTVSANIAQGENIELDDPIAIRYLPDNPKISALESMVVLAEQALNKK